MNNRKSIHWALASSALVIVLCASMLAGTTYAWFTDSASASVSIVQSGTLDVELLDADGNSLEGKTLTWQKAAGHEDEEVLWEPNCTYSLQPITIHNNGNLSLKYKIVITGILGDEKLNDVITWTMDNSSEVSALEDDHFLAPGESDTLTISGKMDADAGDEYQDLTIEGITITVLATQASAEGDSIDDTYDENAQYPDVVYSAVSSQAGLNSALTATTAPDGSAAGDVYVELTSNMTVELENGIVNTGSSARDVVFVGDGTQTVIVATDDVGENGNKLNYQRGSTFTFENLTVTAGEEAFEGLVCDGLVFRNCTIKGCLSLYSDATFIDCVFENTMEDQYSLWTWGAKNVKLEGCTFNTNGKAILLYASGSITTKLTVSDCVFNDRLNGDAGKAAIEIGNDYGSSYEVTVSDTTVNGFSDTANSDKTANIPTGNALWSNKNGMDSDHLTVTIDGVAQTTGIAQ